jgi:hypothetical protein
VGGDDHGVVDCLARADRDGVALDPPLGDPEAVDHVEATQAELDLAADRYVEHPRGDAGLGVLATLRLLGERSWWLPGWLARILPKVELEEVAVAPQVPERVPVGAAEARGVASSPDASSDGRHARPQDDTSAPGEVPAPNGDGADRDRVPGRADEPSVVSTEPGAAPATDGAIVQLSYATSEEEKEEEERSRE